MTTPSLSDWTLERMALGEMVGDELVEAHLRLASEAGGLERLRALEESNVQILRSHPPEVFVPRIRVRIQADESSAKKGAFQRGWWSGLGVGVAAAFATVFFLAVVPSDQASDEGLVERTRLKGIAPYMVVHRAHETTSERLQDGGRVGAGDVLQLSYVGGGSPFGVIVSLDGAGGVTLHHPEFVTLAPVLSDEGRVHLPFSYELDNAPGFERFVFVTSSELIDVGRVLAAARELTGSDAARTGALRLPDGSVQTSFLLEKKVR